MEKRVFTDDFVRKLASQYRVVMLGGMAVIAHGFDRPTKDSDIWLEPLATSEDWADAVLSVLREYPITTVWSLAQRRNLEIEEIAEEIEDVGVIRINGMDLPLDVFRNPNELELADFERVWNAAKELEDGVRLPDPLDLYITKANTGREHDWQDQLFLETLVRKTFRESLPVCNLEEAQRLFDHFLDPAVLGYALENPNLGVRELALDHLRQFETEGDPYSRDILRDWKSKREVPPQS